MSNFDEDRLLDEEQKMSGIESDLQSNGTL